MIFSNDDCVALLFLSLMRLSYELYCLLAATTAHTISVRVKYGPGFFRTRRGGQAAGRCLVAPNVS